MGSLKQIFPALSTYALLVLGICIMHLAINLLWISMEDAPLMTDAGIYYSQSLKWFILAQKGQLLSSVLPQFLAPNLHPRLLMALPIPFYFLIAPSQEVAVITISTISLVALIVATYFLGMRFGGKKVGLISAMFVSLYPGVFGPSRSFMMDLPASAAATATAVVFLHENFTKNWKMPILAGILLGFGLWVKESVSVYLFFPVICVTVKAFIAGNHSERFRRGLKFFTFLAIAGLVASPAYLPGILVRFASISESFQMGSAIQGQPSFLSKEAMLYYIPLLKINLSPVFFAIVFVAILQAFFDRGCLFLLLWALSIYLILSFVPSKNGRYILGILPVFAVMSGSLFARLPSNISSFITFFIFLFGVYQLFNVSFADRNVIGHQFYYIDGCSKCEKKYSEWPLQKYLGNQYILDNSRKPIDDYWNLKEAASALTLKIRECQLQNALLYALTDSSDSLFYSIALLEAGYFHEFVTAAYVGEEFLRSADIILEKRGGEFGITLVSRICEKRNSKV